MARTFIFRTLTIVVLLGCIFSDRHLKANPRSSPNHPTILVVGDSLSAAYQMDPNKSWIALLGKKLKQENFDYQLINISSSGDTSSNGLAKLPEALVHYQPKIVIIALGSNDGLRGLATSELKKNLEKMVTLAKKSGAKVLLIGFLIPVNYGPKYRKQFEESFSLIAEQQQVERVPFLLEKIALDPDLIQEDGLHPNEKAQPIILENIWPFLKKLL